MNREYPERLPAGGPEPATTSGVAPTPARALMAGAMALLTFALYANALSNPFVFDDISIIQHDPRVRQGQYARLITENYWYAPQGENTATVRIDRLYRPLVMVSYALNWAVSQQAWTFRGVNLTLHAAVCFLVYVLVHRLMPSVLLAALTALLFALHPIHTEPLNTIIGRADVAVTLFMLAGAVVYWDDASTAPARLWRPLVAAACFAAALLCKESAVTLIGIVALLDWWRWQRQQPDNSARWLLRRFARCYTPLVLVLAAYLVARQEVLGSLLADQGGVKAWENPIAHPERFVDPGQPTFWLRWGTPLVTLARAVYLHVVPRSLCYDYSYAAIEPVTRAVDRRLLIGAGCILLLAGAAVASYLRQRRVLLAIALSAITYSIVSNVLVVIGTIFGERLLYLPSLGFCLAIAAIVAPALRWPAKTLVSGGALLAVVALGAWWAYLTVQRNRDWSSNEALCRSAVAVSPRSCKVLTGLAGFAVNDARYDEALDLARQAIRVAPGFWSPWRTAAIALDEMDRDAEALPYYRAALDRGAGGDPATLQGIIGLLHDPDTDGEAIALLRQLTVVEPDSAPAHNNLAWRLVTATPKTLRDPTEALRHARTAVRLDPGNGACVDTLVEVLTTLDRRAEARAMIKQALRVLASDDAFRPALRRRLAAFDADDLSH